MPNRVTNRYPVNPKYLMTRGQALKFPSDYFKGNFKKDDVYGMVIDIPMGGNLLTTMVCFINGAANLYFNNGAEYSGAAQKYRTLVQITHNLVANAGPLVAKSEKVKAFDLPTGNDNIVYLLTRGGVYKCVIKAGLIPESEPEKRAVYVLYQKVLEELRNCQLRDQAFPAK